MLRMDAGTPVLPLGSLRQITKYSPGYTGVLCGDRLTVPRTEGTLLLVIQTLLLHEAPQRKLNRSSRQSFPATL